MQQYLSMNDTKKVNIQVRGGVIHLTKIPIRGDNFGVVLPISEIRYCIINKGIVDEILSDGSLVRLDLTNYHTNNEKVVKKEEPKVEAPAPTPAPAVVEQKVEAPVEVKDEPAVETKEVEAPVVEVKTEAPKNEVKNQQQQPQNKGQQVKK